MPQPLLVRRGQGKADLLSQLVDLTMAEMQRSRSGAASVRLGLSELLFVEAVRPHIDSLPEAQTGWLAGLRDPGVGRALAAIHARPEAAWTLEILAREAGVSRSVLAERFPALVGHTPIQYLTNWRMQIGPSFLAEGPGKVSAVR